MVRVGFVTPVILATRFPATKSSLLFVVSTSCEAERALDNSGHSEIVICATAAFKANKTAIAKTNIEDSRTYICYCVGSIRRRFLLSSRGDDFFRDRRELTAVIGIFQVEVSDFKHCDDRHREKHSGHSPDLITRKDSEQHQQRMEF